MLLLLPNDIDLANFQIKSFPTIGRYLDLLAPHFSLLDAGSPFLPQAISASFQAALLPY